VRESLECLEANTSAPPRLVRGAGVLAQCREFTIRRENLPAGSILRVAAQQQARIMSVVAGRLGGDDRALTLGDNILLPYDGEFQFAAETDSSVLITEDFSQG
jgi:mannose-6-phosphate isomerase